MIPEPHQEMKSVRGKEQHLIDSMLGTSGLKSFLKTINNVRGGKLVHIKKTYWHEVGVKVPWIY